MGDYADSTNSELVDKERHYSASCRWERDGQNICIWVRNCNCERRLAVATILHSREDCEYREMKRNYKEGWYDWKLYCYCK
jgi:hypothetical protein